MWSKTIMTRSIITYNQIARQICTASEWRNFNVDIWLNSENIMVILALAMPFGKRLAWGDHVEKEMIIGKVMFEISWKNDAYNNYGSDYIL